MGSVRKSHSLKLSPVVSGKLLLRLYILPGRTTLLQAHSHQLLCALDNLKDPIIKAWKRKGQESFKNHRSSLADATSPCLKIKCPLYCCPLFFKKYFNPQVRVCKMMNEHSVNYHRNSQGLTSRMHTLKFFLILCQACIIHQGWARFSNLWILEYWKIYFPIQNLERKHCYLWLLLIRQNSPPGTYQHPPGKKKSIITPPKVAFFSKICLAPEQRGRGGGDYERSGGFRNWFRK